MLITVQARPAPAMDRSGRSYDADGRLHVTMSNISKATVNPYRGSEIPRWRDLGLDPNRIYWLLRDPEELARAAPTFNRLPILDEHIPVSADAPSQEIIIGTTGDNANFDGVYLRNSTSFWTAPAIRDIERRERVQFSSAYRYRADMTPGIFMGLHYDGIMRDITGNHVALVKEGRAGPDVMVGDSALEILGMKKSRRFATLLAGAAAVAIQPVLAQDATLDISQLTNGVNDAEDLPKFTNRLKSALAGKTREGADLAALDSAFAPLAAMAQDEDDPAEDEDDPAEDEDDPAEDEDKPAEDTAALIKKAVAAERQYHNALTVVRPLVGEVIGMDSAEAVYKYALKQSGVKLTGTHTVDSLRAMVDMALDAKTKSTGAPPLAQDRKPAGAPSPAVAAARARLITT